MVGTFSTQDILLCLLPTTVHSEDLFRLKINNIDLPLMNNAVQQNLQKKSNMYPQLW